MRKSAHHQFVPFVFLLIYSGQSIQVHFGLFTQPCHWLKRLHLVIALGNTCFLVVLQSTQTICFSGWSRYWKSKRRVDSVAASPREYLVRRPAKNVISPPPPEPPPKPIPPKPLHPKKKTTPPKKQQCKKVQRARAPTAAHTKKTHPNTAVYKPWSNYYYYYCCCCCCCYCYCYCYCYGYCYCYCYDYDYDYDYDYYCYSYYYYYYYYSSSPLLPTTYYLLPTTYYLLPTTYYLLTTNY